MKDKKLQEVLTEIREIAGMDAALFSDAAELLVAPFSDMNIRKTDVKAFCLWIRQSGSRRSFIFLRLRYRKQLMF